MNGELAQLIALITYGNEFLSVPWRDAPVLFPSHSTFQYVSDVTFRRVTKRFGIFTRLQVVATDTSTWFSALKNAGIRRLRLAFVKRVSGLPEHTAVAFAGGGTWGIQADSGSGTELWRPRWSVGDRLNAEGRIWSVEYRGMSNRRAQLGFPDVHQAVEGLKGALNEAKTFSESADLDFWARWFAQTIELLGSSVPTIPYHPDLIPPEFLSPGARRLLAGACKAWVFGGMGSWNDAHLGHPSLRKRYDSVTARLYRAVVNAVAAAANSTTA